MRRRMLVGGAGVGGTALVHFTLGSLLPLTYKAVLSAQGSAQMAEEVCRTMTKWVTPLNVVLIAALYVQLVVLLYMILSGRSGLSRWTVLIGPFGAVICGVIWSIVFRGTALQAGWGSCESLGEGLMYITALLFWQKQRSGGSPD